MRRASARAKPKKRRNVGHNESEGTQRRNYQHCRGPSQQWICTRESFRRLFVYRQPAELLSRDFRLKSPGATAIHEVPLSGWHFREPRDLLNRYLPVYHLGGISSPVVSFISDTWPSSQDVIDTPRWRKHSCTVSCHRSPDQ